MTTTSPLIDPAVQHQSVRHVSVDLHRDASRVSESLAILQNGHPNLLLIGSAIQSERVFDQIRPMLRTPVVRWSPVERPEIPGTAFRTLIVRQVECLTASQQISLSAWLRRSTDLQIVSWARMPVFPLVKAGTFLEELYYRLNPVLLEFGSGATPTATES
jgi:hypothetical protein